MSTIKSVTNTTQPIALLNDLPSELIQKVATFLPKIDIVHLGMTCQELRGRVLSEDAEPWKEILKQAGLPQRDGLSPKETVRGYERLQKEIVAYLGKVHITCPSSFKAILSTDQMWSIYEDLELRDGEVEENKILAAIVRSANLVLCEALARKGKFTDQNNGSLLIAAVESGHSRLVWHFLEPHSVIRDEDLKVAFEKAIRKNHPSELIQHFILRNPAASYIPLIFPEIVKKGDFKMVKMVLKTIDPISHPLCINGGIPVAAENGFLDILRKLLKYPNIGVYIRGFAIVKAAKKGNLSIVEDLLKNGPISASHRELACYGAASKGYFRIAKALIQNGPVDTQTLCSVLCFAVDHQHRDFVQFLLQRFVFKSSELIGPAETALRSKNPSLCKKILETVEELNPEEMVLLLCPAIEHENIDLMGWFFEKYKVTKEVNSLAFAFAYQLKKIQILQFLQEQLIIYKRLYDSSKFQ